ncbi:MAG: family transporter [Firmicutes bacterium]|nr:family transporter [Bacillota bacterium]
MKSLSLSGRAILSAFIANVLFGFSFLFIKVALGNCSPYVLLSCRFFVALAFLSLFIIFGKARVSFRGKPWKLLLLLGVFQPVLYFMGETYGVLYTTATFSGIMIALIPIVSLWASALVLRESPTFRQSIFCCVSVFGVILITLGTESGSNQLRGVFLLLLAVFADVAFNLLTRKLSVSFTAFERTFVMFVMGFCVFFTMMLVENRGDLGPFFGAMTNPELMLPILYLGIASSVVAFFLINYANTLLPVTRTVVFINVTTLVSVFAGVVILRERVSPLGLAAAGMIILGVWGVQRYAKKDGADIPESPLEEL